MAKYPGIPITDTGYWCNPKQCKVCNEWYDYCACNQDDAMADTCEDCVDD